MAFPHPKSRNDKGRKKDEPHDGSEIGKFFVRAVNVTNNGNAENDMNPANNRPFRVWAHKIAMFNDAASSASGESRLRDAFRKV